ncbi:RHOMBOID-like 2 [Hibiscus syriacus]|uniref:RHOMBOID-like 2 n=1 Tax=Hibiscus syriacus TaxID=106335 RepID=A0A6A3CWC0_HIBSY|nr:RHOMBOID-like 2 [Hibiscus syriacus]
MGKASKWFRSILSLKKTDPYSQPSSLPKPPHKDKRRWTFIKSYCQEDSTNGNVNLPSSLNGRQQQMEDSVSVIEWTGECEAEDPNRHAIAVSAATAAVSEAAVATAEAAEAVVRLTSSSGRCAREPTTHISSSKELAVLKTQSTFRGYLARRALRALKGLVRLQAIVRGHIERKRTAERVRRMQALLRAQERARAGRAQDPATPEKFEHAIRSKGTKYEQSSVLKRNGSKSSGTTVDNHERLQPGWHRRIDEHSWDRQMHSTRISPNDDEKSDKILEVDTGKSNFISKQRNLFHSTHLALNSDLCSCSFTNSRDSHQAVPTLSSGEVQSLTPWKLSEAVEESPFCIAADDNSPQFYSASSKGGGSKRSPFTPAKGDGSRSYLSGYSDHPNFMSYTESSKAKLRSFSAPKQRPQYERSSSTKRYSIHGFGELKSKSALHANFASKAYPGSGRLDRLGMPAGYRC